MDRKYIDDNAIGIKYLREELDAQELEQFEIYMLENPDIIDELELDEAFISVTPNEAPASLMLQPSETSRKPNSWWRISQNITSFLIGGVVVALFLSQNSVQHTEIVTLYADQSLRGASQALGTVDVALPQSSYSSFSGDRFTLILPLGSLAHESLQVEISLADDQEERVIESFKMSPNTDSGDLNLLLQANKYAPGSYQVTVTSERNSSSLSTYRFRMLFAEQSL